MPLADGFLPRRLGADGLDRQVIFYEAAVVSHGIVPRMITAILQNLLNMTLSFLLLAIFFDTETALKLIASELISEQGSNGPCVILPVGPLAPLFPLRAAMSPLSGFSGSLSGSRKPFEPFVMPFQIMSPL